ncbi:hypothetical protein LTR27_010617 [Elasticomyces elasticus]|nr:hypothetical protein LTR27_010617 [Elasticomyces elasticus]
MATLAHRPNTNSTGTTTLSTRSTLPSSHHTQTSYPSPLPLPTHTPRTPHNHNHNYRRPSKPIRPQYPPSTTEKHVEYILLASFDIDHGSIMEAQYPGPVGGDEHMLAELMLPDQTHLRAQDWTIFFLHKDGTEEEEGQQQEGVEDGGAAKKEKKRKRRRREVVEEVEGEEDEEAEGGAEEDDETAGAEDEDDESLDDDSDSDSTSSSDPPLVYVLNLVNTKTDPSHKRGAVVKAMAICTRHSFLHIYKPLLLLALEKYFEAPSMTILSDLYEAVNAMDLSLIPRLNTWERRVLQSSDAKDLFLEKFEGLVAQRMANDTNTNKSPLLEHHRPNYGLPRDTHEATTHVSYSGTSIPMPIPTSPLPETVGDFSLLKLLTTFSVPHQTSPVPFTHPHPHLTTSGPLTHPIIVLLNALLTQKRIIFLGHNLPSSLVGESVLAACSLASGGLLRGFTRHSFPYTDLSKIEELLRVPGFVAGVTNPVVGMKEGWWDLLCDLSTGRMRISSQIEALSPVPEGVRFFQNPAHLPHPTSSSAAGGGGGAGGGISAIAAAGASLSAGLGGSGMAGVMAGDATGDQAFMAGVMKAVEERQGEGAVRRKFRRWVLRFTRLAAGFEEVVYGASLLVVAPSGPAGVEGGVEGVKGTGGGAGGLGHGYVWPSPQAKVNELAANAARIEGWRLTRSYYNFVRDMAGAYPRRRVKSVDLQFCCDRLAKLRLGGEQSGGTYLALCSVVNSDDEIGELLAVIGNGVWGDDFGGGLGKGASGGGVSGLSGMGQGRMDGLFYLGLGLFHPSLEVREGVAGLLGRVREHEAGRHFWGGVGRFVEGAWERVVRGRATRLAAQQGDEGGGG